MKPKSDLLRYEDFTQNIRLCARVHLLLDDRMDYLDTWTRATDKTSLRRNRSLRNTSTRAGLPQRDSVWFIYQHYPCTLHQAALVGCSFQIYFFADPVVDLGGTAMALEKMYKEARNFRTADTKCEIIQFN